MNEQEILTELEPIIRELFDEYEGPVTAALNAYDVEQWDSIGNVQLMITTEKTFSIRFEMAEITGLRNLGELVVLILQKKS